MVMNIIDICKPQLQLCGESGNDVTIIGVSNLSFVYL